MRNPDSPLDGYMRHIAHANHIIFINNNSNQNNNEQQ